MTAIPHHCLEWLDLPDVARALSVPLDKVETMVASGELAVEWFGCRAFVNEASVRMLSQQVRR